MKSYYGVTFRLYPTEEQEKIILLNCNNARFAYNWGIEKLREAINNGEKIPSVYKLATEFVRYKKSEKLDWLTKKPASQRATKMAFINCLQTLISQYKRHEIHSFPFHSKKKIGMSYYSHESTTVYEKTRVRLENLGWVNCSHNLPLEDPNIKICDPCVMWNGDYYELSCVVKYKKPIKPKYHYSEVDIHHRPIGIDVGITHMAVTSDGDIYDVPYLRKLDKQISRTDRRIRKIKKYERQTCDTRAKYPDDQIPKSQNLLKLESRRRQLYRKHSNILKDIRCKAVNDIIKKQPAAIVIEDVHPRETWRRRGLHKLNKRINDVGVGDFLRRIKHKCEWCDIPLIVADKYYPSSHICSECGCNIDNLLTKDRMFVCSNCGNIIDRDLNAARNLRNLVAMNDEYELAEYA